MPPDSSTPTGTSATMRRTTAVRSESISASCQTSLITRRGRVAAEVRRPVDRVGAGAVGLDHANRRRRQLAHSRVHRARGRYDRMEAHVVVQCVPVDLRVDVTGVEQRPHGGSESQPTRRLGQIQRLEEPNARNGLGGPCPAARSYVALAILNDVRSAHGSYYQQDPHPGKVLDVVMLVFPGGQERPDGYYVTISALSAPHPEPA